MIWFVEKSIAFNGLYMAHRVINGELETGGTMVSQEELSNGDYGNLLGTLTTGYMVYAE